MSNCPNPKHPPTGEGNPCWECIVETHKQRESFREVLEWTVRNLTDACSDLKCDGCKMAIQEVVSRATNALKGA